MQVVIPGSVESIAVSSVQSMNAPFGNISRRVGTIWALTALVTAGRNSVSRSPLAALGLPPGRDFRTPLAGLHIPGLRMRVRRVVARSATPAVSLRHRPPMCPQCGGRGR